MEIISSWYIGWPREMSISFNYYHALMCELEMFLNNFSGTITIQSLLIEGGASMCDEQWLLDTLSILYKRVVLEQQAERSLEIVAPVSDGTLCAWKRMGINRVTITCCLCDEHDEMLNFFLPRLAKFFDNIGVDILLGCSATLSENWHKGVMSALASYAKHISLYFDSCVRQGDVLNSDDESAELYTVIAGMLQAVRFERYSLYDFACAGYRSRCLQAYLQQKNYKGFGLHAASLIGSMRSYNTGSLDEYGEWVAAGREPVTERKLLTDAELRYEKMRFGLCSDTGIAVSELDDNDKKIVTQLTAGGFVEKIGDNFRLTTKGVLVEREVVTKLRLNS